MFVVRAERIRVLVVPSVLLVPIGGTASLTILRENSALLGLTVTMTVLGAAAYLLAGRCGDLGTTSPRGRHRGEPSIGRARLSNWVAFACRQCPAKHVSEAASQGALALLLHLSPVLLLTVAFPVAVGRIADDDIGGVALVTVVLASSVTVPWLSAAACLPLYRALGDLLPATDMVAVRRRFLRIWPVTVLQTAPVVLLFVVPVGILLRWPVSAALAYLVLCLLHLLFAEALVLANIEGARVKWFVAWTAYTAALLAFPQLWFLPPVIGLATQLVVLRGDFTELARWHEFDIRDVAADVVRGALLGSVLWSDKLLLFMKTGGAFPVTTVFLALLPAILAYNYYFVRLAPGVDAAIMRMRRSMETQPHAALAVSSEQLTATVLAAILRTAIVAAFLSYAVAAAGTALTDLSVPLLVAVSLASWLFLLTTVLCYKLDYLGLNRQAQGYSAAHLAVGTLIFVALPPGALLYGVLAIVELVVASLALRGCLRSWRLAEYSLFWRHATAW